MFFVADGLFPLTYLFVLTQPGAFVVKSLFVNGRYKLIHSIHPFNSAKLNISIFVEHNLFALQNENK